MRILVCGGAGLLGSELVRVLGSQLEVDATHHTTALNSVTKVAHSIDVNLQDFAQTMKALSYQRYDLVLNAAGAADVDRCEREPSYARSGNVAIVENLVSAIAHSDARLIHFSTDFVFDGSSGPYGEDASPHPINEYGRTKLEGEAAALRLGPRTTVIRVCALYSTDLSKRTNALSAVVNTLRLGMPYRAAVDLFNCPTSVADLADAVAALCEHQELPQILHLAAPESMSRFDFAVRIAEAFCLDASQIERSKSSEIKFAAKRPLHAGLLSPSSEVLIGRRLKTVAAVLAALPERK